jgi:hypothetical protein
MFSMKRPRTVDEMSLVGWRCSLVGAIGAFACVVAAAPAQVSSTRPLVTAMGAGGSSDMPLVAASGSTFVHYYLQWSTVAPDAEPGSWDPADPGDPHYSWDELDSRVRGAALRHLQVLLTVADAPAWAQRREWPTPKDYTPGCWIPRQRAFGQFAHALATRYSGSFHGLPRIRYFEVWNEPNISTFLAPQLVDGQPVAANAYRALLNTFAKIVHGVSRDNVVVAGGLAPFRDSTESVTRQDEDWGPISFMRALLCVSGSGRPTCTSRADFDVWAVHPYTSGGPTHRATRPNDVSLGDLSKINAVLADARRSGHLTTKTPPLWATEFSWDSSPPDPHGVPSALLSRWVAEALFRMWSDGVSLVTWFKARDDPMDAGMFQSGLYYVDGAPKPALQAYRFPFVALPQEGNVLIWGRTPPGTSGRVQIQWAARGGTWKPISVLTPNRFGIFQATLHAPKRGHLRARLVRSGRASPPFGLTAVRDRPVPVFGTIPTIEPNFRDPTPAAGARVAPRGRGRRQACGAVLAHPVGAARERRDPLGPDGRAHRDDPLQGWARAGAGVAAARRRRLRSGGVRGRADADAVHPRGRRRPL